MAPVRKKSRRAPVTMILGNEVEDCPTRSRIGYKHKGRHGVKRIPRDRRYMKKLHLFRMDGSRRGARIKSPRMMRLAKEKVLRILEREEN